MLIEVGPCVVLSAAASKTFSQNTSEVPSFARIYSRAPKSPHACSSAVTRC